MLTALDAELYPDDCEVVLVPQHDRQVYLIHKNGSSSVRYDAVRCGWTIVKNQQLRDLDRIDVYLRDPCSRYSSGINTFVQHLTRDCPELDHETCLTLASRYLFLNRHYLTQWHWLLNLARWLNTDCKITLHPVEDLLQFTQRRSRAGIEPVTADFIERVCCDPKLEIWFLLDKILMGLCGQSMTWQQILSVYDQHSAKPLSIVLDRWHQLNRVLP